MMGKSSTTLHVPNWRSIESETFTEDEVCRHIGAFGQTGSGKTVSIILPAIEHFLLNSRETNKSPALVIDPKGELKPHILSSLKRSREKAIDFNKDPGKLWLFNEDTATQETSRGIIEQMLKISVSSARWEETDDPMWPEGSKAILQLMLDIDLCIFRIRNEANDILDFWEDWNNYLINLKNIVEKNDKLSSLVETTTRVQAHYLQKKKSSVQPMTFRNELEGMDYLRRIHHLIVSISKRVPSKIMALASGAIPAGWPYEYPHQFGWKVFYHFTSNQGELFHNCLDRIVELAGMPSDTYYSFLATIKAILTPLENPELCRKVSFNPFQPPEHCFDPFSNIKNGRITFYVPPQINEVTIIVGRLLKEKFFSALLNEGRLNNPSIPVFYYICDEFQRFITSDEFSGEQSFLDRCRAYRVSCVVATQSISALLYPCSDMHRKGELAVKIILSNICNKFFFRSADPEDTNLLKTIISNPGLPRHPIEIRGLTTLKPGECYCLLANGKTRRGKVQRNPDKDFLEAGRPSSVAKPDKGNSLIKR